MSYEDLIEAEKERDRKVAASGRNRGPRKSQCNARTPAQVLGKRSRSQELEEAANQIEAAGLKEYCSVLSFN